MSKKVIAVIVEVEEARRKGRRRVGWWLEGGMVEGEVVEWG